MAIKIPAVFEPYESQQGVWRAIEDGIRKVLLCWPRQFGKDSNCFAIMCQRAAQVPGNYFYIFPTKEEARRALWEKVINEGKFEGSKLIECLPSDPKLGIVKRISNQEMSITLFNNSTIRVLGLDTDPDAGRGISPTGVVLSEFAFSDPQVYKNILPSLKHKKCWIIINSTPNGPNHFYRMFRAVEFDKSWYVSKLQATKPELPGFVFIKTPEEYKQLIAEGILTVEDIEREYGCSFSTEMKGTIYATRLAAARKDNRIGAFAVSPHHPFSTYWDLGLDDSTAIWEAQKQQNKYIMFNYFEDRDKDLTHYVSLLKETGHRYSYHYVPHDAGHRIQGQFISTKAQELQKTLQLHGVSGTVVVLTKNSVQLGIENAQNKLMRTYFHEVGCTLGLEYLELYHKKYDKKKRVYLKDPVHDFSSHAADAFRAFGIHEETEEDPYFLEKSKLKIVTGYDPYSSVY